MRSVIYPGSFDPITKGHLDIIEKSSKLFDKIYIVVTNNDNKKHLLNLDFRTKLVFDSIEARGLNNIEVISHDGITSDLAKKLGVVAIIRGIRNTIDLNYEYSLEEFTRATAPNVETIYFSPAAGHMFTSSSLIRNLISSGNIDAISRYVPPSVCENLKKLYKNIS